MKIKPSKSRSILIIKGRLSDHCLFIEEESIPIVMEKPVKSLRLWYDATLKDTEQVDQLRHNTLSGLERIDKSLHPSRLKLWRFQFGLQPWLMWPLILYEVLVLKVKKLERLTSSFV